MASFKTAYVRDDIFILYAMRTYDSVVSANPSEVIDESVYVEPDEVSRTPSIRIVFAPATVTTASRVADPRHITPVVYPLKTEALELATTAASVIL